MSSIEINSDFANNVFVSTLNEIGCKLEEEYTELSNGGRTRTYRTRTVTKEYFETIDQTKFVESCVAHGKEEILDKNIRSSKIIKQVSVRIVKKYQCYYHEINPKLIKPISHSLECKFPYKIDLIKYEEGDHFNEFHYDTYTNGEVATVLVFPPNNIFTGGNLVFKLEDKIFSLDTSKFSNKDFTIVIFSDILHKCEPIISGTRFVFKTSIISSMPKILSDDLKFKLEQLEQLEQYKSNINAEDYKKLNQDKITQVEGELEKAIDKYFNFKRDYVKENLPDDFDDEFKIYDIKTKLSEYKNDYKRLIQQHKSLKSRCTDIINKDTIYEKTYTIDDHLPNICVLPTYIEDINNINNYSESEVEYIKTMLEKGYNIVPIYMKIELKTDFEDGWRKIYGSTPIDINEDNDYGGRRYNLQYNEGWVTCGKELDYHSEYNDQSGDDIYEKYECSCLLIWKN